MVDVCRHGAGSHLPGAEAGPMRAPRPTSPGDLSSWSFSDPSRKGLEIAIRPSSQRRLETPRLLALHGRTLRRHAPASKGCRHQGDIALHWLGTRGRLPPSLPWKPVGRVRLLEGGQGYPGAPTTSRRIPRDAPSWWASPDSLATPRPGLARERRICWTTAATSAESSVTLVTASTSSHKVTTNGRRFFSKRWLTAGAPNSLRCERHRIHERTSRHSLETRGRSPCV